jgi:hypothetical protein
MQWHGSNGEGMLLYRDCHKVTETPGKHKVNAVMNLCAFVSWWQIRKCTVGYGEGLLPHRRPRGEAGATGRHPAATSRCLRPEVRAAGLLLSLLPGFMHRTPPYARWGGPGWTLSFITSIYHCVLPFYRQLKSWVCFNNMRNDFRS